MLSRDYVNRIQINDKIGAGLPLTPNYSTIYPKVITVIISSELSIPFFHLIYYNCWRFQGIYFGLFIYLNT